MNIPASSPLAAEIRAWTRRQEAMRRLYYAEQALADMTPEQRNASERAADRRRRARNKKKEANQ